MHAAATLLLALGGLLGLGPGEAGASETNCRLCVELVEAVEVWVQADAEMDFIVEEAIKICTGVGFPHSLCETIIEAWLPGIIEADMLAMNDNVQNGINIAYFFMKVFTSALKRQYLQCGDKKIKINNFTTSLTCLSRGSS